MRLFSTAKKRSPDNKTISVNFDDDTKQNYGVNTDIQRTLQSQVKDETEIQDESTMYINFQDFVQNISNEDLYEPIMTMVAKMRNTNFSQNNEETKYEISEEEKNIIKNNIANGNFEPTESIQEEFYSNEDIRITSVETNNNNVTKTVICALLDYKGKNDSLLVTIPIDERILNRYNELLSEDNGELLEYFKEKAYRTFLSKGIPEEQARKLGDKRALSMLKGRAIISGIAEKARISRNKTGKESLRSSFLKINEDRQDRKIIERTTRKEEETVNKDIKEI